MNYRIINYLEFGQALKENVLTHQGSDYQPGNSWEICYTWSRLEADYKVERQIRTKDLVPEK